MSSDFSPELRAEFLDDFYAECDELLTSARAALTQLEGVADAQAADPAIVETLYRNVHSLKGISAIVGLRPAEHLAHAMEDLLRALTKKIVLLSAARLDALAIATQRLDQIVTGHRLSKALPDASEAIDQLRESTPPSGEVAAKAAPVTESAETRQAEELQVARARGLTLYLASFSPTPALDQRGVNVTAVRERLTAIGEIFSGKPSIPSKGSFVFEFVVGLSNEPAALSTWENDGVRFQPLAASVASQEPAKSAPIAEASFTESLSLTPSHMVRVDLARLDDLMRITAEMVIHRSRLEDRINQAGNGSAGLKEVNLALARSLREMREAITRVRMVPIGEIFSRIPFVVRDLARASDKKARVVLEGQQTEVDKYLVERLKEPLLHLVRNAFAHGIESTVDRIAAGKPPEATILLRAKSEGESVVILIRDDGCGVDSAAVAARAASLGLSVPDRLDGMGILKILCTPGFSTRTEVDLAAGRGVGMAVVANTVREMGGTLTFQTTVGSGTEFTLRLPLTLSIADAIIVSIGTETCAVVQNAVNEIIQVASTEVRLIQQTSVIPYRGGLLPLVWLRTMFRFPAAPVETLTLLVLSSERGACGVVVDRVRGQREIVIRPLADTLLRVPGISGATELGDGRPILILDPGAITQGVVRPPDSAGLPETTLPVHRAS